MVVPYASVDVATWRTAISQSFVGLDVDPQTRGDRFSGLISGAERGQVRADRIEVRGNPHVVRRPRGALADGGPILVSVQLHGTCVVTQQHHEAILQPHMLTIYDTAKPYELAFPEGDHIQVVLRIPRRLFPVRSFEDYLAVPVSGAGGAGHAVAALLTSLPHALAETSAAGGEQLVRASLGMLALSLGPEAAPAHDRDDLLAEALRFIGEQSDSAELTPGAAAEAVHVSVGHLHRIFRRSGASINRTIVSLRLERCAEDLRDSRLNSHSIADIAMARGFKDAAHFTRTFAERYGMPPSVWRGRPTG